MFMQVVGYESLISDVSRWSGPLSQNVAHSNPLSMDVAKAGVHCKLFRGQHYSSCGAFDASWFC
jgi:hypothetical protein